MKIVQSLWSKPGMKKGNQYFADFNKCGWRNKKYNYFSWALSALQFTKYYDKVELVTDKIGYELLIKKFQLPYTNVEVVLDNVNRYYDKLFIVGKVYAYSIQQEPFIHADADIFIWDKLSEELENASLICQSREEGTFYNEYYSAIFFPLSKHLDFCPQYLFDSISLNNGIKAVNMGITGGCNLDFIQNYASEVFNFIDKNATTLSAANLRMSNVIFEQFVFSAFAENRKEKINFLEPEGSKSFLNDIVDITGIPERTKYVHFFGGVKQLGYIEDFLEYQLMNEYPDYYFRILNLLRTGQI
jgi:hypothetical protein